MKSQMQKFKEGRGQGSEVDYLPWLRVQDVPSTGRSTRGVGWTTGRQNTFYPIWSVIISMLWILPTR